MNIDREKDMGSLDEAKMRVSFCLDQLEKAHEFSNRLDFDSDIVSRLYLEEMIGALVSAEQSLMSEVEKQLLKRKQKRVMEMKRQNFVDGHSKIESFFEKKEAVLY